MSDWVEAIEFCEVPTFTTVCDCCGIVDSLRCPTCQGGACSDCLDPACACCTAPRWQGSEAIECEHLPLVLDPDGFCSDCGYHEAEGRA